MSYRPLPVADRAPDLTGVGLVDRFGRRAVDLRLSVVDKCNLRCTYCMPAEGLPWLPASGLMSLDEITRLVTIGVRRLGVRELRLTGGEPLVRKDLEDIVSAVRTAHPDLPIALTTNGVGLAERAEKLRDAGLDRLNVSLDSLHPQTFAELTRRPFLQRVLAGLDAAAAAGFTSVKINTVLVRGTNEHEAADLVSWALAKDFELRFIEQMPLDADRSWSRRNLLTAGNIRDRLRERFELSEEGGERAGAPAERYQIRAKGAAPETEPLGTIGIIASVTEPFCSACTRTRITADGYVRSCLFSNEETSLLDLVRQGGDDGEVARLWQQAMWAKPRAHGADQIGLGHADYVRPARTMSAIGG